MFQAKLESSEYEESSDLDPCDLDTPEVTLIQGKTSNSLFCHHHTNLVAIQDSPSAGAQIHSKLVQACRPPDLSLSGTTGDFDTSPTFSWGKDGIVLPDEGRLACENNFLLLDDLHQDVLNQNCCDNNLICDKLWNDINSNAAETGDICNKSEVSHNRGKSDAETCNDILSGKKESELSSILVTDNKIHRKDYGTNKTDITTLISFDTLPRNQKRKKVTFSESSTFQDSNADEVLTITTTQKHSGENLFEIRQEIKNTWPEWDEENNIKTQDLGDSPHEPKAATMPIGNKVVAMELDEGRGPARRGYIDNHRPPDHTLDVFHKRRSVPCFTKTHARSPSDEVTKDFVTSPDDAKDSQPLVPSELPPSRSAGIWQRMKNFGRSPSRDKSGAPRSRKSIDASALKDKHSKGANKSDAETKKLKYKRYRSLSPRFRSMRERFMDGPPIAVFSSDEDISSVPSTPKHKDCMTDSGSSGSTIQPDEDLGLLLIDTHRGIKFIDSDSSSPSVSQNTSPINQSPAKTRVTDIDNNHRSLSANTTPRHYTTELNITPTPRRLYTRQKHNTVEVAQLERNQNRRSPGSAIRTRSSDRTLDINRNFSPAPVHRNPSPVHQNAGSGNNNGSPVHVSNRSAHQNESPVYNNQHRRSSVNHNRSPVSTLNRNNSPRRGRSHNTSPSRSSYHNTSPKRSTNRNSSPGRFIHNNSPARSVDRNNCLAKDKASKNSPARNINQKNSPTRTSRRSCSLTTTNENYSPARATNLNYSPARNTNRNYSPVRSVNNNLSPVRTVNRSYSPATPINNNQNVGSDNQHGKLKKTTHSSPVHSTKIHSVDGQVTNSKAFRSSPKSSPKHQSRARNKNLTVHSSPRKTNSNVQTIRSIQSSPSIQRETSPFRTTYLSPVRTSSSAQSSPTQPKAKQSSKINEAPNMLQSNLNTSNTIAQVHTRQQEKMKKKDAGTGPSTTPVKVGHQSGSAKASTPDTPEKKQPETYAQARLCRRNETFSCSRSYRCGGNVSRIGVHRASSFNSPQASPTKTSKVQRSNTDVTPSNITNSNTSSQTSTQTSMDEVETALLSLTSSMIYPDSRNTMLTEAQNATSPKAESMDAENITSHGTQNMSSPDEIIMFPEARNTTSPLAENSQSSASTPSSNTTPSPVTTPSLVTILPSPVVRSASPSARKQSLPVTTTPSPSTTSESPSASYSLMSSISTLSSPSQDIGKPPMVEKRPPQPYTRSFSSPLHHAGSTPRPGPQRGTSLIESGPGGPGAWRTSGLPGGRTSASSLLSCHGDNGRMSGASSLDSGILQDATPTSTESLRVSVLHYYFL